MAAGFKGNRFQYCPSLSRLVTPTMGLYASTLATEASHGVNPRGMRKIVMAMVEQNYSHRDWRLSHCEN
jgi:hypothetical protein